MITTSGAVESQWCIVIVDDNEVQWTGSLEHRIAPIQYQAPDEGAPLLQRALRRAISVAPASHVLITALEEYRNYWQPLAWFVRAAHRIVCRHRAVLPLCTATAILAIADHSPSAIVTVLPARGYVAHEWILKSALMRALEILPDTREGIITLGMRDIEENFDEDYLIVSRSVGDRGLRVDGYVRRPVPWVAAHLKREGALVASGLLVGYAGAFASHISRVWPGISSQLQQLVSSAESGGPECTIPAEILRGNPTSLLRALRWSPPVLPQRVLVVTGSGWNGLRSPRAIMRLSEFYGGLPPDSRAHSVALQYFAGISAANSSVLSAQQNRPTDRLGG